MTHDSTVPDDIAKKAMSQLNINKFVAGIQNNHEEAVIKNLCTELGLPSAPKLIAAKTRERTGTARITAAGFAELCPTFPVTIRPVSIGHVQNDIALDVLFNSPQKTKVWKKWHELYEEVEPNTSMALVFDYTGIRGKYLALHNYENQDESKHSDIRTQIRIGQLTMESFGALLTKVKYWWVPPERLD